jgi:ATP-grasp domain/L-amino acid ligase C-terminal domain 2/ATP-grasp N-terminal domain
LKRLLLIGAKTGYQTRVFAEAAVRLGLDLTLATDRCHTLNDPWGDQAVALEFKDPEAAARKLALEGRFDGVVALGDGPAYLAAVAAEQLGLPYNSPQSAANCGDKFLARKCFYDGGLLVPNFRRVLLSQENDGGDVQYPCVLKPLSQSASRGVIRADNPDEFVRAFERIRTMLRPERDEFLLVEDFIPGREFALEGLLNHGVLQVLAIFDKPDPLDGPFFEETIYVTPPRSAKHVQQSIRHATAQAIQALGLTHGPVHAEMRVNDRGVWMLEVAARPIGGLCAKVLPGLEELILRHAAGEDVSGISFPQDAAGVMMVPIPRAGIYAGVSGEDQARAVPLIEDVIITAKLGQHLLPLPEGKSYLGFLFARGPDPVQVEAALRECHAELRFEINTALKVM